MKAIRIHDHGSVDVLAIDDIAEPPLVPHHVKVRLGATALNHMDIWVRKGLPGILIPLPIILGCEGAGVITDVGEGCRARKPGEAVMIQPGVSCGICAECLAGNDHYCSEYRILGEHTQGCHAQWIVVPEENVVPIPKGLTVIEAAAIPLVFITAWQMVVDRLQLKPGETVLVIAAASGIGSAAVQIAKLCGARVIATVGNDEKGERAKALGADALINHRSQSISEEVKRLTHGKGVEAIFEHVGQSVWLECMKSLARRGRLVTCGATTGPKVEIDLRHVFIKNLQILGSTMAGKSSLYKMLPHFEEGRLKPVVDRVFHYTEVGAAQRYLESSQNFGKVVLNWEQK